MPEDKSERTCYVSDDCKKCDQNKTCTWAFNEALNVKKIGPKKDEN
jgi:hypothetical protein